MDKDKRKQGVMDQTETDLTSHNSIKWGKKCSFICPKPRCGKVFSEQTALDAHGRYVHEGIKECEQCYKTFSNFHRLLRHVSMVHNRERKFKCKVCSKSLVTKVALQRHMLTHLESRERRWKCELCSKTFLGKGDLLEHIRSHTGEKPYSCDQCGKGFTFPKLLKQHAVVHSRQRLYPCSNCTKAFSRKSTLRRHQMVHTGERRHGCSLCELKFQTKCHLARHMVAHTGEKPYSCSYCLKSFPLMEYLSSHVNFRHLRVKKAECAFCQKAFSSNSALFQHLRVHTSEAPYFCKTCPAEFKCRSNLEKHTLRHSAPKTNARCNQYVKECGLPPPGGLVLYSGLASSYRDLSSSGLAELKSQEKPVAQPINYSCIFCFKGFSEYGHMCSASALRRWKAICRISS